MVEDPGERSAAASVRPYLNTRQAAHRLGLSPRTLETMRKEGEGPIFRRHGRLVYYHIDDLELWSRASANVERGS